MFEKTTFHSTEGGFLCSTEGVFNPAWLKDATETQETIATRSFVPSVEDGHHPGTPDLGQRPYGQEIDTLHRQYIDPQVYHNLPIDSLQAENNNLRAQLSCTLAVLENEKEMNNNLRNQLYSAQTVIEVHSEIRKAELEHCQCRYRQNVPTNSDQCSHASPPLDQIYHGAVGNLADKPHAKPVFFPGRRQSPPVIELLQPWRRH